MSARLPTSNKIFDLKGEAQGNDSGRDRETTRLILFLVAILGIALFAYFLAERLGSAWCWACG